MSGSFKVLCFTNTLAWSILLFLQIAAAGLGIASVFIPTWVTFSGQKFGLYYCSPCLSSSYYTSEYFNYCSSSSTGSYCSTIAGLYKGEIAYLICVGVAVIFTIAGILNSFCFMSKKNYFKSGVFIGFTAMAAEAAGIVSYTILTNTVLSSCSTNFTTGQLQLCADQGLEIAIASGGTYVIAFIFYLFIGCSAKNSLTKTTQESRSHTVHNHSIDMQGPETKKDGWIDKDKE
jgi:hypothetical protein